MATLTTESLREAAGRAFLTAFLLSGDTEQAEAAVLSGIETIPPDEAHSEGLLQRTVRAAIERREIPWPRPKEMDPAFLKLPFELRRVLRLPRYLRQCFVLRVLAGLPRELCATLLRSDTGQVDQGVCAAMLELPAVRQWSIACAGHIGSNN
jgi:hypothetical protein